MGIDMSIVDKEKKFHNEYFSNYSVRERENRFYEGCGKDIVLEYVFGRIKDIKGPRVLYYGCGENISVYERFKELGADVVLIDISDVALEKIKAKYPEADTRVMDAQDMGFKDGEFDLVFGRAILHHLDLDKALKEVKRVLKPDGRAIFIEPMNINPFIRWYRKMTPDARTTDEHPFVIKDIKLIRESFKGFTAKYFYFTALIAIVKKSKTKDGFLKKLCVLDEWIFKVLPILRFLSWIGVFEVVK
jgi:ubiquinone/menaquinone biosynthesis C-methylase UbiE